MLNADLVMLRTQEIIKSRREQELNQKEELSAEKAEEISDTAGDIVDWLFFI